VPRDLPQTQSQLANVSDSAVAGAMKLPHLNPQTQEFNIG
jgi:hypothetical protein